MPCLRASLPVCQRQPHEYDMPSYIYATHTTCCPRLTTPARHDVAIPPEMICAPPSPAGTRCRRDVYTCLYTRSNGSLHGVICDQHTTTRQAYVAHARGCRREMAVRGRTAAQFDGNIDAAGGSRRHGRTEMQSHRFCESFKQRARCVNAAEQAAVKRRAAAARGAQHR